MPKISDGKVTFGLGGEDLEGKQLIEKLGTITDPRHLSAIAVRLVRVIEGTREGYQLPGAFVDLEGIGGLGQANYTGPDRVQSMAVLGNLDRLQHTEARGAVKKVPSIESDLGKDGDGQLIDDVEECFCDLVSGSHSCSCGPSCKRKKGTLNATDPAQ